MSTPEYENPKYIRDMALHNAVRITTPGTSAKEVVETAKLFEAFLKGEPADAGNN